MNPANDALYTIHLHQAHQWGRSPLSYREFCGRLHEKNDLDLTGLLLPRPEVKATVRITRRPKFDLGRLCITQHAAGVIPTEEVLAALARHAAGEWGEDLCPEDVAQNERAVQQGGRIFSAYVATTGQKFWIITESDHSVTTVLLPQDY